MSAEVLNNKIRWLEAELEQARSTCPHSNCDAQRFRDALKRIEVMDRVNEPFDRAQEIARDALAGDNAEG